MVNKQIEYMTGDKSQPYPSCVGAKFHTNGTVRKFPGNTLIYHIDKGSDFFNKLLNIQSLLQQSESTHSFTFIPPASYHMTLFAGVLEERRKLNSWPKCFAYDTLLKVVTQWMKGELAKQNFPQTVNMIPQCLKMHKGSGTVLALIPADDNQLQLIRNMRDKIAKILQFKNVGHQDYEFHVSLSYMFNYISLNDAQQLNKLHLDIFDTTFKIPKAVQLSVPELCVFNNMFKFNPIQKL